MQKFASGRTAALPPLRALQTPAGRVSYLLSGAGRPSILLFNGAGVSLEGWQPLWPAIGRFGTVLAWNRFGMEGSDPPREPQTGAAVLGTLRELLHHTGLPAPYLLVGHSLGGLFANLFARLYPEETAGVLFIEATHPGDGEMLKKHENQLVRALGKLLALPQALFQKNVHSELDCADATAREVELAGPFPPVPVRVLTGGLTPKSWLLSPAAVGARRAHQQELARLSPLGEQVIAHKSGHFPQLTQPRLVLAALAELLDAVRA
jgi:pimeloyl-ACP methyl ester carboxylesterase